MQLLLLAVQLTAASGLLRRGPVVGQVANLSARGGRSEPSAEISGWGTDVAEDRLANQSEVVVRSGESRIFRSLENRTITERTSSSVDNSITNQSDVGVRSSKSMTNRSVENKSIAEHTNGSMDNGTKAGSEVVKRDATAGFAPGPFQKHYQDWQTGRGLWKWNVVLGVYDRHLISFAKKDSRLLEVGVQSGGSIRMYHKVLPRTYYFGLDVNGNCSNFTDARSSIFVGDQESVATWDHFFSMAGPVDMLLDDGGHRAEQMLATLQHGLPRVNPGGLYFAEGIHAANMDYLKLFFFPAADFLADMWSGTEAKLFAVHIYPFMLGVELGPGGDHWLPPNVTANATYGAFDPLLDSFQSHRGEVVRLHNKDWGSSLGADSLKNFFNAFHELHGGKMQEVPLECHANFAAKCTMIVGNTALQDVVRGVHIYEREAFVELHADPPLIFATRMGDEWIPVSM